MKPVRAALLSTLALLAAAPAFAETPQPTTAPQPPALIVTVVVDQFSANLFNQYRDQFTGGLKTLADQGLVYANGYQSHAVTETCPGHSTVLTGSWPTHTGIPANDWIDRAAGEEVYCLAAPRNTLAHGKNTDNGPVGPDQLKVTTVSDWLKAASPQSRVFTVSGKDRGAINLAGHHGDGVFWYTEGFGFTTYVEPGQDAARRLAAVAPLNAAIKARLARTPPTWTYTSEDCRALDGDWSIGGETFHSTLPPANFALEDSPLLDELTLEAATTLLEDQQLGRRGVTDLLGVSLSATDRIGHGYGTQGPEMCEQMHRLDVALGAFLTRLNDVPGGVLIVLTADHGGSDFPERLAARGYPDAARGDRQLLDRANAALRVRFNLAVDPLESGASGVMVVGEGGRGLAEPLRAEVASAAVDLLRAERQVAGAWTLEETLASSLPTAETSPQELSLLQRERLGAVAERSPDILMALKPDITPGRGRVGGTVSGHGTPWDYDRRVPIIFWSPNAQGQERFLAIQTVDIAPTLARVMGLTTPDTVDGRCRDLGLFGAPACDPAP